MNHFAVTVILLLSISAVPAFAAERGCSGGKGEEQREIGSGFHVIVAPTDSDDPDKQCRAAVMSADGAIVYEAFGNSAEINPATGRDLDGDEQPDVVLETAARGAWCCYAYDIVSLAEPAGLIREISTSVPLTFEDRDGDGRIEIMGRDFAFKDFDDMPASVTPAPLVILRLKGSELRYVSPAFWADYETEIARARGLLSQTALDDMINAPIGGPDQKPKELNPQELRAVTEAKGLVLEIVLAYLYGGRGPEAWKELDKMWPPIDKPRIRQLILKARSSGLLSEINRPKK